jgi:transposase
MVASRKEKLMAKKWVVVLTADERNELLQLTSKGRPSARKVKRANILLLSDAGKTDAEIAESLHTSRSTVERTRRKFVEGGLEFALNERQRPGQSRVLDAKAEAVLATIAQSEPPEGQKRWTLRLLTSRLIELGVVETVSRETVRQALKKTD